MKRQYDEKINIFNRPLNLYSKRKYYHSAMQSNVIIFDFANFSDFFYKIS
jgi:hypothetical protein